MIGILHPAPPSEIPDPRVIVRLKTSFYSDARGLHKKRSLTYLKRKCRGFNFVDEDRSNAGDEACINQILNLDSSPDGIYEIEMTNISYDTSEGFSTGYIDGYDFKLAPFTDLPAAENDGAATK